MSDIDQHVTPTLREAIRRFGFHKVAAKVYGVTEITEKTATQIIGERLLARQAEWRNISSGLRALQDLSR